MDVLDRSERLVTIWSVGVIKPRYSGTLERSYMSNGCCDCDALIGEFYEHDAWHDEEATLAEFQTTISQRWVKAIESAGYGNDGWGVFTFE